MFVIMHYFTPVGGHYNVVMLVLCVWVLLLLVTMVYGPMAAFLAESFPARVRYTSVSLPYHIGNGYFGGFLPFIATVLYTSASALNADKTPKHPNLINKAPYVGLLFPVVVAAITFVIGMWLLSETKDNKIDDDVIHQRGYSPVVLGVLVALSAIALIAADHYITPALNTKNFNVQWFFRILALIVAVACIGFALLRRRFSEEQGSGGVSLQTGD
jgi:hypothetical protein